jgi:glycine/D-amino acid oxidase-like deaminating enzyme
VVTVPMPEDFFHTKILIAASYIEAVQAPDEEDVFITANMNQVQNGNLILGTLRQFSGFDYSVDPRILARQMKRNLRFFPSLSEVTAIRTWTGLRPSCKDALPIISPVSGIEGLYIASGHDGLGITEGPVTGKLISQMVTGQPLVVPVEQLSFERFKKDSHPTSKSVG